MNKNSEYEKMPKNLKGLHLSDKEQHDEEAMKFIYKSYFGEFAKAAFESSFIYIWVVLTPELGDL